jgi:hypothetical protein
MSRPKGPFFRHSVMILAVSEEKCYFSSMNKRYCRECTVKRPENDETARREAVLFSWRAPLSVLSLLEIVSTENADLSINPVLHMLCSVFLCVCCQK